MPKFTVYFTNTCSYSLEVEAENAKDAIDVAYDSDDMVGGITVGAFSTPYGNSVDDGDWEAEYVTDESHKVVWEEKI